MKRSAQNPPSVERRKVQHVSCPCCEARLALHFVHGEDEVYDVEFLTKGDSRLLTSVTGASENYDIDSNSSWDIWRSKVGSPDSITYVNQTPIFDCHSADITEDSKNKVCAGEVSGASHNSHGAIEVDTQVGVPEMEPSSAPKVIENTGVTFKEDSSPNGLPSTQVSRQIQPLSGVQPKKEASQDSHLFPLFYRPKKTVHLVRHGQTSMWVAPEVATDVDYRYDLRLTPVGRQQASSLAPKMASLKPDLILVSPLSRALETLQGAFPSVQEGKEQVVVTALHTEHVSCSGDIGRPPQVLAEEYPWLSFVSLPEVWWYSHPNFPNNAMKAEFNSVEPMEDLRKRVGIFRQFLRSRQENVIIVIGHSTFFKELTSTRQRMKNCEVRTLML